MMLESVQCILCRAILPTSEEDILQSHMKDHHRVFANLPFILSACFLNEEGIRQTTAFININKRIFSVEEMLGVEDPLQLAEKESGSSTEDPGDALDTMEKLSDISQKEDLETSLDIDQESFIEATVLNEISVESGEKKEEHLNSYQELLQGLELSQSLPRSEKQNKNISALESLSEENPDLTDSESNPKNCLTLQDLLNHKLYKTDHSYSKLKRDETSHKIIKKKSKKKDQHPHVTENGTIETIAEEVYDIKPEELEEDDKPEPSPKEGRMQRWWALCLEECGEEKALTAGHDHLRRYHGGGRPFKCTECRKRFKNSFQLESHTSRKHRHNISNICDVCGKYFKDGNNILGHKRSVHLMDQAE